MQALQVEAASNNVEAAHVDGMEHKYAYLGKLRAKVRALVASAVISEGRIFPLMSTAHPLCGAPFISHSLAVQVDAAPAARTAALAALHAELGRGTVLIAFSLRFHGVCSCLAVAPTRS